MRRGDEIACVELRAVRPFAAAAARRGARLHRDGDDCRDNEEEENERRCA